MNSSNFRIVYYGALLATVVLYCGACSTTKPASAPQQVAQPQKTTQGQKGEATKPLAKAPVSQPSSLEQLQQGKRPGTTASSPVKDVYFGFDSYDLQSDARTVLKANAEWLKQNPSATVQIEGHCDDRGTAEYNLALGAKRAQTAKDYLATLGVPAQRISTISYGEELPVCNEHSEECWQKNRHDRFVIKNPQTN